ncbi:MAG TPA: LLM class flavin-dependent oxidoreductase [Miltoncostaeaceae bacterium]|nr:LLM class flavin-dependent oxidoreductase [Miltoncostaeaceae bacterium]
MSVRVGLGWNPFEAVDPGAPAFWEAVEAMEELGYDSLWLSDTATLGDAAPLPTLAAVAARTRRLKLGTGVIVAPARNPVLLAKELATVDAISGGRLFPAMGLGIDEPRESMAMGVERSERPARLAEAMAIVRALWAGGPVSHEGRFWSFEDVTLAPAPTRPRIEIWLAGHAPRALRRAGRLADGWLGSFVAPSEIGGLIRTIQDAAAEAGRAIDDDHYGTTLFATPDESLPPAAAALLDRRPGLSRADHVAVGAAALRRLLERFVAEGASKFVVVPMAADLVPWLRELQLEAVGPVEAR